MRLLAINASHRGDRGFTRFFIDRLFAGAAEAGAACEVITLARLKINRCLSCYHCQNDASRLECVHQERDDARLVFERMSAADLLVYATPVYLMSMSGLLKTFLDRTYATMDIRQGRLSNGLLHHHVNAAISSKPFVALIVCNNLEDEAWRNVASYFRTYARFMEARQAGTLIRNAALLFDHANRPGLARDFPATLAVAAAYAQAGRELATAGCIRRATQRRANQEVVPVPFFRLLKRLPPVKRRILAYMSKELP
jgi:putative NADPH-quinone reductase